MKSSCGTPCCLHIVGVAHGSHQGSDHLWRVHDGVTTGLLLRKLVHHHGSLADDDLILVIQELGQLGNCACCEVSIVLVVDEVDDGVLQHLAGLGKALDSGGLVRMDLGGRDLDTFLQGLREHGGTHSLGPRQVQLLVHLCNM